MPFNDPGTGGDFLPYHDVNGSLLLVTVHEETDEINTVHGPNTAIRADVAVLDGAHKGEVFKNALIFPRVLKGQLRGSIGSMVLGRLGQGAKKPGQDPPWTLTAATDDEKATGEKYLAYVASQAPVEEPEPEPEMPF